MDQPRTLLDLCRIQVALFNQLLQIRCNRIKQPRITDTTPLQLLNQLLDVIWYGPVLRQIAINLLIRHVRACKYHAAGKHHAGR